MLLLTLTLLVLTERQRSLVVSKGDFTADVDDADDNVDDGAGVDDNVDDGAGVDASIAGADNSTSFLGGCFDIGVFGDKTVLSVL